MKEPTTNETAGPSPFEQIKDRLPAEQREDFEQTMAQLLQSSKDEEEDLLILKSMAQIALMFSDVPERFGNLLKEGSRNLSDDQVEQLQTEFREILTNSLDVPNYQDMSEMTRAIKETYQKHHQESGRVLNRLGGLQREISKYSRVLPVISAALITSVVTLIGGAVAAYFLLPKLLDKPITVPKHLWPYVELQKEGRLKHIDSRLPKFSKGEVRILTIEDDVLGAFMDGEDAVIVLEKPSVKGLTESKSHE